MFARLICLSVSICLTGLMFFAGTAWADDIGKPAPTCRPKNWNEVESWRDWASHTPVDNTAKWAEEKQRWVNNRDVWRWLDKLFIAVEGGKVVTLADCPFGDEMYVYLYDHYDEAGGFHLVQTLYYEDHYYTLVMRKTGRLIDLPGRPIWSPDKARFAYGVCDLLNGKEDFAILSPTGSGVREEMKATIPCGLGDCTVAWESPSVVTATCLKSGEQGNERKRVRYTRQADKWVATTTALK